MMRAIIFGGIAETANYTTRKMDDSRLSLRLRSTGKTNSR